MKAVIRKGPGPGSGAIEYRTDVDIPTPKHDEVLIKVKATAICGSDIAFWKWNDEAVGFYETYGCRTPYIWGHEFCGVVEAVGDDVSMIHVGDHVAIDTHMYCGECYQCRTGDAHVCQHLKLYGLSCNGSFAEYTTAPESICYVVPDSVSFENGAMLEPGCCAMFGIDEASMKQGDVAMIYGCGPIGLIAIQILIAKGAKTVIAVDINDQRCELARELGAVSVNSLKEDIGTVVNKYASERGGVDLIIELSGAASVYATLFDYLRPAGHVSIITHPAEPVSFNIKKLQHKSAKVTGIYGRRIWESWDNLVRLIVDGRVDLSKVIAKRMPLKDVCRAFEMMTSGSGQIIFLPEME